MPEMFYYLQSEDYDCIATRRVSRADDPPIRLFFARMFYTLINIISDLNLADGARNLITTLLFLFY